jgi:hypothetical protein
MTESASRAQLKASVAPLNFIYACSICCTTFADTYEGHDETVQGLSDGINPKERLVTRIYLGSCCHVFCAKHLEGGGMLWMPRFIHLSVLKQTSAAPTFHPDGQRPKATCPVCVKDKGDSAPRDLYSIRGFHKDEFDPAIPPVWFTTPPVSLDGKGKEMEALRVCLHPARIPHHELTLVSFNTWRSYGTAKTHMLLTSQHQMPFLKHKGSQQLCRTSRQKSTLKHCHYSKKIGNCAPLKNNSTSYHFCERRFKDCRVWSKRLNKLV